MRERIRGVPVGSVLQLEQASDVMAALVGLTIDQLNQLQDDEKAMLEQFSQAAISWALDECVEATIEDLKAPSLIRDESLQGLTIYEFPEAGRLQIQYVAGSETCSAGAEFQSIANEGQSLRLQWKLTDVLRVGESATIRFKCKVR